MWENLLNLAKKYVRIITIILAFLFLSSLVRNIVKIRASGGQIEEKRKQVEALEAEQNQLQDELKRVESDSFVEKQLRDSLGYAKEDEIVIVLPDEDLLKEIGKFENDEEDSLPDPNWIRWAKLFELM